MKLKINQNCKSIWNRICSYIRTRVYITRKYI